MQFSPAEYYLILKTEQSFSVTISKFIYKREGTFISWLTFVAYFNHRYQQNLF